MPLTNNETNPFLQYLPYLHSDTIVATKCNEKYPMHLSEKHGFYFKSETSVCSMDSGSAPQTSVILIFEAFVCRHKIQMQFCSRC